MRVLSPGSKLGRFEISAVIGQGAMGVVYLANDPEIERPVAIKTVRPETAGGAIAPEPQGRFLKEAKLAGRLQHPNIVTVYDVGRDRDVCFIAMEYVDGRPLTRYLGGQKELPLAAKVGIIRQAAEALAHAHERDVLHRDIKPGNILIARDGRVKVTDFGIGKLTSAGTSDLTRTGQMIGSPAYMSPEQVRGERLDGRSDLFSLGVVLYELLTGVRPFPGESITTLVYQILHTEPRDPLEVKAGLPAATRDVMARILAKQPEKRPANAREFIRELRRIEKFQRESEMTRRVVAPPPPPEPAIAEAAVPPASVEIATTPAPPPPTRPGEAPVPRRAVPAAVLSLAALVLGAVAALQLWERRHPPKPFSAEPSVEPTVGRAAATATTPAPVPVAAEVVSLPTPGPRDAADVTVGAPRAALARKERPPARAATEASAPLREEKLASASEPPPPASSKPDRVDAVYSTRRTVRFTSSPDQARLEVDGRYVGIADDWDNRGGGREFEFDRLGKHYVRMELPGYRTRNLEIDVSADAEKDSVSIDDELERDSRVPYEKLPGVFDRTTGAVEFSVDPPDALVAEKGKTLGAASSFGAASPLELRGPAVHDLFLTAPGRRPKMVRILVASNAGRDRAVVKLNLKRE